MGSFYSGRHVVVTGGAGMIGSKLVELLVAQGADVTVTIMDNFSRGRIKIPGAYYLQADARDLRATRAVFREADIVFNLAALVAGAQYNSTHQLSMFEENMQLQSIPVQAAQAERVSRFLQVSSICIYAPEKQVASVEADGHTGNPIVTNEGYSWAKRLGERVTFWSYLPHAVVVRPSNCFGENDHFDDMAHVIPALIIKALNPRLDTLEVYGNGTEKREFIYCGDVAAGMMAAMEFGQHREAYNLSTNGKNVVTIGELAQLIQQVCGTNKPIKYLGGDGGDPSRWATADKMREQCGWESTVSLEDGLKRTVDWYLANR